ncbi:MAG TPA: hypothetical protein VGL61_18500 [Kofleriaceae bacterium]|jgi:hypothetical protein
MRAWLVIVMASVARVAVADPVELPDRAGLPDDALHLVGGFGFDLGRIAAGPMIGYAGVHGVFGVRRKRVAVLEELALVPTEARADDEIIGGFARGALEARVSLWQGRVPERRRLRGPEVLARGDVWIEPAIGYELASRPNAPVLGRADASLAIGYQETRHEPGSWNGTYAAVRVTASGDDLSVLFTSGVVFGN